MKFALLNLIREGLQDNFSIKLFTYIEEDYDADANPLRAGNVIPQLFEVYQASRKAEYEYADCAVLGMCLLRGWQPMGPDNTVPILSCDSTKEKKPRMRNHKQEIRNPILTIMFELNTPKIAWTLGTNHYLMDPSKGTFVWGQMSRTGFNHIFTKQGEDQVSDSEELKKLLTEKGL